MTLRRTARLLFLFSCALLPGSPATAGETTSPQQPRPPDREPAAPERWVAGRVDALRQGAAGCTALPPALDDEAFLRGASFDLTGKLPSPDDLHRFTADRFFFKQKTAYEMPK